MINPMISRVSPIPRGEVEGMGGGGTGVAVGVGVAS